MEVPTYPCHLCDKAYKYESSLSRHLSQKHDVPLNDVLLQSDNIASSSNEEDNHEIVADLPPFNPVKKIPDTQNNGITGNDFVMLHPCNQCSQHFSTVSGVNIHKGKMHKSVSIQQPHLTVSSSETTDHLNVNHTPIEVQGPPAPTRFNQIETATHEQDQEQIVGTSEDVPFILPVDTLKANLPPYTKTSVVPKCSHNNLPGEVFSDKIIRAYNEVIFWRKNLFMLPSGKAGKQFIKELTFWLEQFNRGTKLEGIALKVYMLLPGLLMQKPSKSSKAKEHAEKLVERMHLWSEGNIEALLKEGRTIQKRITTSKARSPEDASRIFAKLMMQGKVRAAIKFLSENSDTGILPSDDQTIAELKKKHPEPADIMKESLLQGPIEDMPTSYFDEINEDAIKNAARQTRGAAGPSKLDSDQYKSMIVSNKFKSEGKQLREQIAALARKLATTITDPALLEAYTTCNLIPLNKNPGVRPIGVGEILRRIIGKVIGWTLKQDIQQAAGPLQVATGLESGAEAAIHAMREIFEGEDCEAVILVDASNAFNALNRQTALHNIQYICPPFATILINTYRQPSRLIISKGKEILSMEGTTQGDNLAMSFYALGTTGMQLQLRNIDVKQVWLADDGTGGGKIISLRAWWDLIIDEGKKCGYYVNEPKSWIIVKSEAGLETAKAVFSDTAIKYTCEGKRHLGASIGSTTFRQEYANEKIDEWCKELTKLAEFAIDEPQAAFAAYTHGEMHKFNYFLRTIPGMETYLQPLDDIIDNQFLPAVFGNNLSETERRLIALPIREGGLGISKLAEKAPIDFTSSKIITAPLIAVMLAQEHEIPPKEAMKKVRSKRTAEVQEILKTEKSAVNELLDEGAKRAVGQAQEKGSSTWLNVLPLKDHGFVLRKDEFRDALALRYNQKISNLPSKCACGALFEVTHAMNCKKGGFVSIRHDTIRNFEANLIKKVCNDVEIEPHLIPVNNDEARLDIRARGFWRPGQSAFFDVRVTNTNAASQVAMPIEKIYKKHENEKKKQYNDRVLNNEHGSFTPLVFSINGGMSKECKTFHKHLADKIAVKTGQQYEHVISWIRCKLSFVVMRSALLCLRGSRTVNINTDTAEDFAIACDEAGLR